MRFRLIIDPEQEEEVVATVHDRSSLTDEIEALVTAYAGTDKLPAFSDDGMKLLPFSQIECITVLDSKVIAIDRCGTHYRLKQRLYELEQQLSPSFIRINKSTLANEKALDRFRVTYAGSVDAVFKCGYTEYVSRRCFAQIKRRLESK